MPLRLVPKTTDEPEPILLVKSEDLSRDLYDTIPPTIWDKLPLMVVGLLGIVLGIELVLSVQFVWDLLEQFLQ